MTSPGDGVGAAIERDLASVIADVLARHESGFVTNWVALIETVGADGKRGLWTMASPDLKAWDTAGMLTHGLHMQQAQALADLLTGDE